MANMHPSSPTLLPPRKSVELEDPGAHELASDNDDDVFADARSEHPESSNSYSPKPATRVEEGNDGLQGKDPFHVRTEDAIPNEIAVVPEGGTETTPKPTPNPDDRPTTPPVTAVPKTVVEKVDPVVPSHGDIPGTAAHEIRKADAIPDVVVKAPGERESLKIPDEHKSVGSAPVPTTVVTKVDSRPSHGEMPGTVAYDVRTEDAQPDVVEERGDVPSWPTSSFNRSSYFEYSGPKSTVRGHSPIAADGGFGPMDYEEDDNNNEDLIHQQAHEGKSNATNAGVGDDFDDFEEGAEAEDFGEFDDGFQLPEEHDEEGSHESEVQDQSLPPKITPLPFLNYSDFRSLDDYSGASSVYLDVLFPTTAHSNRPSASTFAEPPSLLSDRSRDLWNQLIAPPPLQPPDWVRSRIRRLFLVSLGVPVDLDEILPASKQRKLVLPSPDGRRASQSPRPKDRRNGSMARLRLENNSTASFDSTSSPTSSKPSRKRKGPPPPPEIDLGNTRLLCATTDAALLGFTYTELGAHVARLEELTTKASEVLEYWLKRREAAAGDREVFEGVIENLVKHARRVRR